MPFLDYVLDAKCDVDLPWKVKKIVFLKSDKSFSAIAPHNRKMPHNSLFRSRLFFYFIYATLDKNIVCLVSGFLSRETYQDRDNRHFHKELAVKQSLAYKA